MNSDWQNKLYFGDNLEILRDHVGDESVDLIYLDPPFNSNATYNVLFHEKNGSDSTAQIEAFDDTWHWDRSSEAAYREVVERAGAVGTFLQSLRQFLGTNDMMAYLTMMAIRLVELHRVLKPTGSIYLHCDPTASHYLKLVMDAIFSQKNFLNEIVWCYDTGGRSTTSFPRKHDIILRYGRTGNAAFYYDNVAMPRDPSTMHETVVVDEKGRKYQRNIKGGKEYRYYMDKGVLPNDWWADVQALNPAAKERLGYPTQKPEALLERIIRASSNEGDLVLDPFCGCGTTIAVAERLHRRWIGIDITHLAIMLMRHRLEDAFPFDLSPYEVIGDPKDLQGAEALAKQNRFQFEWWALGLVDARPAEEQTKGADKGIDGYIAFFDDDSAIAKRVIVQVKSGKVRVSHIRDLIGVLDREKAQIGAFITLERPTRPMKKEAIAAGFYDPPSLLPPVPRLQILTIEELLRAKKLDYPKQQVETFWKSPRKRKEKRSQ